MRGELQRWSKLSLALEDAVLRNSGVWLSIAKNRRLRKFAVRLKPSPFVREVSIEERPETGCGIELTRLEYEVSSRNYIRWTFGVEAFGPTETLLDIVQPVCRMITAESTFPELGSAWTGSYPSWLISTFGIGHREQTV
jgi:hypothetical protein